jgi:hypothetical protein
MFLTLLCSAVRLAAKAFHQDPNGDGSILSFTHSGLLKTCVGFAHFINAKNFSANHVLHVTFIPAESHKTLKPKILEFLQPAAPLEISIHPDVRDGATVDAALGFANQLVMPQQTASPRQSKPGNRAGAPSREDLKKPLKSHTPHWV